MFGKNPFDDAFGLDIGDLSLKLIQLSVAKKHKDKITYRIQDSRQISLPAGYIVNGEIQQPEMVRKKLLQLLDKVGYDKKITSPWVVADLPEPKTFLTSIEFDMPAEQITKEDVEFQCQKHLPFDLNNTYLDWQIIPRTADQKTTRVLIGAVEKIAADSYTYLLQSANLQPVALEVEALAIARVLINENSGCGAILDLGASRSAIIIYDKGGVRFSTSLNFSGELINTALSQNLKIDYQKIEEMKIKNGLNYIKEFPNYLKIVDELTEELLLQIKKAFDYYSDHYPNSEVIEKIILCGGMAEMENLRDTLARRLNIPCEFSNSFQNIVTKNLTDENKKTPLTMISALGLAMRATVNPYNI